MNRAKKLLLIIMLVTISAVLIGLLTWLIDSPAGTQPQTPPERFSQLLIDIRTQRITPYEAEKRFQSVIRELHYEYPADNIDSAFVNLIFPIKGRNYRDVGGKGRGFYGRHYDMFDHSVAKSHPAHDIFIFDPDRDCIDDRTGEYADVVAVSRGIVIATETAWTEAMDFKGGNYVWMYDLQTGGLWYYAHLRAVYVHPGQIIQAGDKLGEVGRSGFNATANRSDTHLHLMHLTIEPNDLPRPLNHYDWLKNAQTIYQTQIPYYEPPPRKVINAFFIEAKPISPVASLFKFPVISVKPIIKIDRSKKALRRLR